MVLTPFRPPCIPSKLASHASRKARTTARSLSLLDRSSSSFSNEEERQAETPIVRPAARPHLAREPHSPAATRQPETQSQLDKPPWRQYRVDIRVTLGFKALQRSLGECSYWAEGYVATKDHSARWRRLLRCLRVRKVERISEGEAKYHRQWAGTVASKALLTLAGGEELEEGVESEEN
ncbi:hypothetical protein N7535_001862 [Penicillium sp. DV-2018c]|nr:hypothetical protein N7535_001862 [Penicillium sp. DV-2018c]